MIGATAFWFVAGVVGGTVAVFLWVQLGRWMMYMKYGRRGL